MSLACMDFRVEPMSVRVRPRPTPHALQLSLPPFGIQSLRCDPRVSWTQGASVAKFMSWETNMLRKIVV